MRRFYKPSLWIPQHFLLTNPNLHHGLLGLIQQAGIVVFYLIAQELVAIVVRSFKQKFKVPLAEYSGNLVTPAARDVMNQICCSAICNNIHRIRRHGF